MDIVELIGESVTGRTFQVRQHTFMTVVLRDIRPVASDNDIRTLKAVNNKGKSFMLADR